MTNRNGRTKQGSMCASTELTALPQATQKPGRRLMRAGADTSLLLVWSRSDRRSRGLDGRVRWRQATASEAVSEQQGLARARSVTRHPNLEALRPVCL